MPWHVEEQDNKYCVIANDTGDTVTCHDTRQQALDHVAALYANVPDATKAGAAISRANMTRIQSMHDMACQMGAQCDMGNAQHDYTPIGKSLDQLYTDLDIVTKAISGREDVSQADRERAQSEYGNVTYADEKNKKYPLGNEKEIRAAWSYINMPKNQEMYSSAEVATIKRKIVAAWKDKIDKEGPPSAATKAGALVFDDDSAWADATIKALGDRTLELRVAWGFDNHREQFHPQLTDFDTENFPTPPVAYYHGYTEKGQPAPKPVYIGKTIKRENRADGHYLIAKLNKKPEADRVWAAALKGEAVVSPATAGHLRRKAGDGTLTYWPIVEISAWDYAETRKQAHPRSVAFPVLKALYQEAGLSLPASLENTTPEASGDDASARASDISPDEAVRVITAEVAAALLTIRKQGAH